MNKDKIFSDLADLAGGAATMFSAFREQMRNDVKDRMDEMAERLDFVTRADITRLEGMIEKLRTRLDQLEKGAAAPRAQAATKGQTASPKPARKSAAPSARTLKKSAASPKPRAKK